ncbi:MAG TPA: cell division protein SepF, partial [Acidimicrobiales bacterium]
MWRKAMLYLGLGPDEEYDDYEAGYDDVPERPSTRDRGPSPRPPAYNPAPAAYPDEPSGIGAVRPMNPRGDRSDVGVQVQPSAGAGNRPRPQVVRPMAVTPNAKPHLVAPTSFNQAQEVADKFKGSQPTIMNLQGA